MIKLRMRREIKKEVRIKKTRKAQLTLEFILIFSLMFALFIGLEKVILIRMGIKRDARMNQALEDVSKLIKDEIINADKSMGNYSRTFELPTNLYGSNYTMNIEKSFLVIKCDKYQLITLLGNVTGEPKPKDNSIKKINGHICINAECS